MKRDKSKTFTKQILLCCAGIIIGYYMLNYIAIQEDPPLGNTFHIVVGCVFIAVSAIGLGFTIKEKYFPKKKRKRSKPIFLEEVEKSYRTTNKKPKQE